MINDRITAKMIYVLCYIIINLSIVSLLNIFFNVNLFYIGSIYLVLVLFMIGNAIENKIDKMYPKRIKRTKREPLNGSD